MELIIAILCFLGLMSYNEAGVTQQQVEEAIRSNNVTVDVTTDRQWPQRPDRTEGE